ncbi:MAG: response regulator, partial [Magnetospirillum sp.]|nr:response regulator [Magnetospirillum sp.]
PAASDAESLGLAPRPLKVLLAEDNPVNQALVAHMLERMGHSSILVEHGAQAVELAATQSFDAILMDMQMPVMDGETATRLIRALPDSRANVPIIALTADAVLEHRDRYLAAGLDAFLTKPVSWKLLARTLDEAAARRPTAEPEFSVPQEQEPEKIAKAAPEPPSQAPVIDRAYLEDMRQWVGDTTLLSLLATAHDSFTGELAVIRKGWASGDLTSVRETAHRLKGAAGSVGCRRLADLSHRIQKLTQAELGENQILEDLIQEVAIALEAISQWKPMEVAQ